MRNRTYRYAISKDSNGVVCDVRHLPTKQSTPVIETLDHHNFLKIMDEGAGSYDFGYMWIVALVFIGIMIIKTTA